MKWLDCTDGVLRTASAPKTRENPGGLAIFDQPLAAGAVHEFLFDPRTASPPAYLALSVLSRIINQTDRAVTGIWCDPDRTLYPPAIAAMVSLNRLYIVYPGPADVIWTAAECLRCPGVGVVVATLPARMTRVEARRIQLAAERGGGVGLMLRPTGRGGRGDEIYSAATRWIVAPTPGERGVQRWSVQLVHGHGRQTGRTFLLENRRAPDSDFRSPAIPVRPPAPLVDHPPVAETG
jgi:hypothetical protein